MGWTLNKKNLQHCLQQVDCWWEGEGCCWLAGHIWPAGLILQMSVEKVWYRWAQSSPAVSSGSVRLKLQVMEFEYMGSDECHRRASESMSCPCCCAVQAVLGESLLEAWRKDRERVGALSFPYWQGGDTPLCSCSLLAP